MRTEYPSAADLLTALESEVSSMSINWEAILAYQYRHALPKPRTVVDVGAHRGMHTANFVNWAQSVVCFEPIPALAGELRQKFKKCAVTVHPLALSNYVGDASFMINDKVPSESGLQVRTDAKGRGFNAYSTITVRVERLDNFHLERVDFIKLDCEGAELFVLQGAETTIERCRPLMSIEYGAAGYSAYGLRRESLYEWSRKERYAPADLFGYVLDDRHLYDQCVDRYYWDFFLIPRERLSDIGLRLGLGGREVLRDFQNFRT